MPNELCTALQMTYVSFFILKLTTREKEDMETKGDITCPTKSLWSSLRQNRQNRSRNCAPKIFVQSALSPRGFHIWFEMQLCQVARYPTLFGYCFDEFLSSGDLVSEL